MYKIELQERFSELVAWNKSLDDSDPLPHDYTLTHGLYLSYKQHGTLPENGGILDQADYIFEDFNYYDLMYEMYSMNDLLQLCDRRIQFYSKG